jgi:hypothetical protein
MEFDMNRFPVAFLAQAANLIPPKVAVQFVFQLGNHTGECPMF